MRNYLLLIIGTMTLLITLPKPGARVISLSGFAQCQVKKAAASSYAQTHKCSKGCWRHAPSGERPPSAADASGCSEQIYALSALSYPFIRQAGVAAQRQGQPAVQRHPAPEVKREPDPPRYS
jgi:hypothetical protein